MLERNNSLKTESKSGFDLSARKNDIVGIRDVFSFLREYVLTIAFPIGVAILLAFVYVATTKPIYTARGQVLIDPGASQISVSTVTAQRVSLDAAQVASEITVLGSEAISAKIVDQLKLVDDPEFQGGEVSFIRRLLSLARTSPASEPKAKQIKAIRRRIAIETVQKNLDIRRSGLSYAINIYYSSGHPEKSARIANAIMSAYLQDQLDNRREAARQTSKRLLARILHLRRFFNQAADALKSFKAGRRNITLPKLPGEKDKTTNGADTEVTLALLSATVEAYRKMYESSYAAFTDAEQREAYPFTDARSLTHAVPPLSKSHPRNALTLVVGALGGLLVGLGIAFLRYNLDDRVRTSQEIEERTGASCLVEIPFKTSDTGSVSFWHSIMYFFVKHIFPEKGRRIFSLRMYQEVINEPFSRFTAAIKFLKSIIARPDKLSHCRIVGVSSPLTGEGKNILIANLGTLLAKASHRVLLIDADIHDPVLSTTFLPDAKRGVLEVLEGKIDLKDHIVCLRNNSFSILPAVAPRREDISYELLGGKVMRDMLEGLRKDYDFILINMPALTPVADSYTMSTLFDEILLTASWRSTPTYLLADVVRGLRTVDANLLGIVLTNVGREPSYRR